MIKNINNLKIQLKNKGIPFIENESHIIPVIIGDPKLCKKASELL